jgi:hypothetical protein
MNARGNGMFCVKETNRITLQKKVEATRKDAKAQYVQASSGVVTDLAQNRRIQIWHSCSSIVWYTPS